MQLNIKNEDAHRLAADLARLTGESMAQAVTQALRERLEREKARRGRAGMAERLLEIGRRCSERRVLDNRSSEEIVADLYDENGLPK
jgi:antitoxin VapB